MLRTIHKFQSSPTVRKPDHHVVLKFEYILQFHSQGEGFGLELPAFIRLWLWLGTSFQVLPAASSGNYICTVLNHCQETTTSSVTHDPWVHMHDSSHGHY